VFSDLHILERNGSSIAQHFDSSLSSNFKGPIYYNPFQVSRYWRRNNRSRINEMVCQGNFDLQYNLHSRLLDLIDTPSYHRLEIRLSLLIDFVRFNLIKRP